MRDLGQQLGHHVLTELLGSAVRVVVAQFPAESVILGDVLAVPRARDRRGRHIAEASESVVVRGSASELDHLQGASEVRIQARLRRLSIQRCGAVDDGRRVSYQPVVRISVQTKPRSREVAEGYVDASTEGGFELVEVHVELQ